MIGLILAGLGGIAAGAVGAVVLQQTALKSKAAAILREAEKEGEALKKEKMLQSKERYLELKEKHEQRSAEREAKIREQHGELKEAQREHSKNVEEMRRREKDLQRLEESYTRKLEGMQSKESQLDKTLHQQLQKLESLAGITAEQAKEEMIMAVKAQAKHEASSYIQTALEEAKMTANKEAKKIVIQTIQRIATEQANENAVSVFHIENDEMKGRIIGREGRNIRALEAATGVEIVVDDTPEAIILSCFDPVRREIARLSLHRLVTDGRIHPARIEEVVEKVTKSIEDEVA